MEVVGELYVHLQPYLVLYNKNNRGLYVYQVI